MAIQGEVLRRLGETVPVAKVSVVEGSGRAAPIIATEVIASGGMLDLRGGNLLGLELEIAAVLRTDLTPRSPPAAPTRCATPSTITSSASSSSARASTTATPPARSAPWPTT